MFLLYNGFMDTITYAQFEGVDLRVGTILRAEPFTKTRRPAYKLWADFGAEYGVKKTSAQITARYKPEDLIGRQIVGCMNLGQKQIADFMSDFLCLGFPDANGDIVLAAPEANVPNGGKLF